MAAKTRFGLEGYGVRRAGSFAGKILLLRLVLNPKWLRPSSDRVFGVEALPRGFSPVTDRAPFSEQSLPRTFAISALPRTFAVQGKP